MRLATLAAVFWYLASVFASFPTEMSPYGSAATAGQFRAFWADAFGEGLGDQAEIDALVAATKAAHANAIVAQVVRREYDGG